MESQEQLSFHRLVIAVGLEAYAQQESRIEGRTELKC